MASDELNDIIYDGVADPVGYEIWRREKIGDTAWKFIDTVSADFAEISESSLFGGFPIGNEREYRFRDKSGSFRQMTEYIYKIAAYNGAGRSAFKETTSLRSLCITEVF